MTRFSANLGFLWKELSLPDAIRAASAAGFDAVECHWPYETPQRDVLDALRQTGLKMLSLNTLPGNPGEMGLSALPERETEARDAIDNAIAYASEIGAERVHVMAGLTSGKAAEDCFVQNLRYACECATPHGITILIEPLNHHDVPGYFLQTVEQAADIISAVARPNLRLMFDCYHVQIMQGDLTRRLTEHMPIIGHIQFASVPGRAAPDRGEVNFAHLFSHIAALGYDAPLGAEYVPDGRTEDGLAWLKTFRAQSA